MKPIGPIGPIGPILRWAAPALLLLTALPAAATPTFDAVRAAYCPSDVRILDRHGRVLHEQRVDPQRRRLAWTPLEAISPALVEAVLLLEDRRFFTHGGIDWRAMAAALWQWVGGGKPRGASTVTMQLAAHLDPELQGAPRRSLSRKWRQMQVARDLEAAWTKREILEAYLNLVTFRGELQGVAAAAELLFAKAPHGLTRAESLVLAALLRSPNARRDALTARVARHARSDAERAALDDAVGRAVAAPARVALHSGLAPHAARRLLSGDGPVPCGDVRSTLDADVQRHAIDALRRHLLAVADRSVHDGAVLVVDNASGAVLAYVGASGTLSHSPHVDGVQARRQAGSTLKPFLYAHALERRLLTAASLLDDSPLEIATAGGLFRPRDYDDQFRGLVSLRSALAASLNVPAVRTAQLVGLDAFAEALRGFGFTLPRSGEWYGPSLALGSADVTLWELVGAYRALARGGVWQPLQLQPDTQPAPARRVTSAEAAYVVADVLADRESRSLTFGLENPLATPFWSAVKTGTSTDMRDNWCIGYSAHFTVGVWVGNFSGAPMQDVSGITGAAPIWEELMRRLHGDLPSAAPAPPPDLRAAPVTFADGVEPPRREWFLAGTEPPGDSVRRARQPRITAPSDGTVIALDPDIPAERQRVAFIAADARDAAWHLDGHALGAADQLLLWSPVRGDHVLHLVDTAARPLAAVRFQVR